MKLAAFIAIGVLAALPATAQEADTVTLDEAVESANQWAKDNLDDDVLRALQDVDQEKVKKFLEAIGKRLRDEHVLNLAALKDTAAAVLPILDKYEETYPYAVWLRTRLDYLEVASRLGRAVPAPKVEPGKPVPPNPNPTPRMEREVWVTEVAERPWPPNAKPYVAKLKPIFSEHHAPPELVWLAEVESSFDPRARSPAGAAGLFQMMPATARQYGLRTKWPFDQRYKAEPSAGAAAKYLHDLHERFGDWRLALAAYNAGEGTVQNLLTRHKARDYDAIAEHLPAETQMYVPKVEAVLLRREGLRLGQLGLPAPAKAG